MRTRRLDPVPLDDFDIREPLGSGAMARVFEAIHKQSGKPVAIKLLDAAARGSRELRERMAREALVLASLQSPHVSRLLGYGWESEQPFLVLERLEGETLADVLRREKRLGAVRLVDWVEQLLVGVRDCHRASVIHRDIKPANIFLESRPDGGEPVVKLIDFGVARLSEIANLGTSLTSTHHLIGSVGYMAPEQLEYAKGVGPTADLYAIGVVIFRCISGRLPFIGRSFDVLTKLKTEATPPVLSSLPGVPPNPALDAFLTRALSRDPHERYENATAMLEEWWRVAAALDRDTVLPEIEVVWDEDEWTNTMAESLTKSGSHASLATATGSSAGPSSSALRAALVRNMVDDMEAATDPQMTRPSEGQLAIHDTVETGDNTGPDPRRGGST